VLRAHWRGLVAAALAGGLALAPLRSHTLSATRELGWRQWEVTRVFLAPAASWLYAGPSSLFYGWEVRHSPFDRILVPNEQSLGIGWITPLLCLWGLFGAKRAWTRALLLAAAAFGFLVTAWPGGIHPWRLVFDFLPTASGIRAVSRAGLLLLIPAAIGLALLLERLRSRWAIAVVLLACTAEQVTADIAYARDGSRQHVAGIAQQVDPRRCDAFFVTAPPKEGGVAPQLDAMLAASAAGVPTVNGYSGYFPRDFNTLYNPTVAASADVARIRADLAAWGGVHGLDPARLCVIGPAR
jgi:hypothetical protein